MLLHTLIKLLVAVSEPEISFDPTQDLQITTTLLQLILTTLKNLPLRITGTDISDIA